MIIDDNFFMKLLVDECWKYQLLAYPNPTVGAMVVNSHGGIIGVGIHTQAGMPHAEVLAIKEAFIKLTNNKIICDLKESKDIHEYLYKNHDNIFNDCTIYTTLEPCSHYGKTPPCAMLLQKLNFKKVVVGQQDLKENSKDGNKLLENSNIEVKSLNDNGSKNLLLPFSKWIENRPFVFFKYAQTLNGVVTGGYISCQESLNLVHRLRDKIDLLVIGGDTVRIDRPTLDTRFIENGQNPDVLIYSRKKEFDKNIPLFSVPNRSVFIEDTLEKVKNYRLVMFEGGEKFLNLVKNEIDMLLILNSQKTSIRDNLKVDLDLNLVNMYQNDKDIVMWFNKS
jgi:diaminohydroxyphosphoribosylaminopyrimidine deaminase/5-amino-6-(5-phosphoribosylamino)uracil reductase